MTPRGPWAPSDRQILAVALVVLVLLVLWLAEPRRAVPPPPAAPNPAPEAPEVATAPPPSAGSYLFCTWNVENFYDDRDDPAVRDEDEDAFGRDPDLVRRKVELLAEALLLQQDGRGPDILAMVEVESRRAVELLRDALNARLPSELAYTGIIQRDNHTGRHFAPAILTRLRARDELTRTFGIRRILEAHIEAEGAPLVVLASHWTSRVTDATDEKRSAYADALYRAFLALDRTDPAVDVLLSGDFNDEPGDDALQEHLHVTGDVARVRADGPRPPLLDLVIGRDPRREGTYLYHGRWQFLDHIVVAPGLLDDVGWQVLPETLRTEGPPSLRAARDGAPRRFGSPRHDGPRGPSDHFALTVRLRVRPRGPTF
jgi:endonuclease/exonuclease/phosphatase family metal-dependent hydrolase